MKFDKNKVYTAVNADELKVGSKVIVADSLVELKAKIEEGTEPVTLRGIESEDYLYRFLTICPRNAFAYLVEEPEVLKWTDLKIGDVIRQGWRTRMVTGIDNDASDIHIAIGDLSLDDYDLEKWEKVEK